MWLVVATAHADDAEARARLFDALLVEAARGDAPAAAARCQELARTLPAESPVLAEALYWLGRTLYELDRVEEARAALVDGIRTGRCGRCRALLEEIELEQHGLQSVPTTWTFDGPHGLFHRSDVQDRGAIRVATGPAAGPALEWTTVATPGSADRLEAGVRAAGAEVVRFSVRSDALDAWLEIHAEDLVGRVFTSTPIEVPRGATRRVTIALRGLEAAEGAGRLDPSALARIAVLDRTGLHASGPNTLWIDDFEVR